MYVHAFTRAHTTHTHTHTHTRARAHARIDEKLEEEEEKERERERESVSSFLWMKGECHLAKSVFCEVEVARNIRADVETFDIVNLIFP